MVLYDTHTRYIHKAMLYTIFKEVEEQFFFNSNRLVIFKNLPPACLVIFLLWLTSHNAWLKSCYTMYDVYIGPVFSIQMYYCTRDSRSKLVSLRRKEDYIHAPITLRKVCFLMRRTSTGEVELSKYYTSLHWKYTGHNSLILNLARQKSFLNLHLK